MQPGLYGVSASQNIKSVALVGAARARRAGDRIICRAKGGKAGPANSVKKGESRHAAKERKVGVRPQWSNENLFSKTPSLR